MKWLIIFINSKHMLGCLCFFCSFSVYFCGNEIGKSINCRLGFIFQRKHIFGFVLFYQKIINTISTEFSPALSYRIKYPVTPNPIMFMKNVILYTWRLKISSSCWAPVTMSTSFNTLWKFGIQDFVIKLGNLFLSL